MAARECNWESWHYENNANLFVLRVDKDTMTSCGAVRGRFGYWICNFEDKKESSILPLDTPIDSVLDTALVIGRLEGLVK